MNTRWNPGNLQAPSRSWPSQLAAGMRGTSPGQNLGSHNQPWTIVSPRSSCIRVGIFPPNLRGVPLRGVLIKSVLKSSRWTDQPTFWTCASRFAQLTKKKPLARIRRGNTQLCPSGTCTNFQGWLFKLQALASSHSLMKYTLLWEGGLLFWPG